MCSNKNLESTSPSPCRLQIYFPTVYDIKYLMKFCDNLHGGLNKLAEVLDVDRIGPQHQARAPAPLPAIPLLPSVRRTQRCLLAALSEPQRSAPSDGRLCSARE